VFKIFKSNLQRGNNNRKSLCTNSLQRRTGHAFGRLSSTSACKMTHKPHFTDMKAEEELDWAWEYDPYSYKDSNF
ncbi:MAG: hypothetical protein IJS92_02580, partial [Paludibacteraceae bacterium]|nr:hypothetical protein [Paludibacteraceae bacterium]